MGEIRLPFPAMSPTPVNQAEMDALALELRALMERIAARTAKEDDVWGLLDRASQMVDRAIGGPFEQDLHNAYALLAAVWSNVRAISSLRRAMGREGDDE